MKALAIKQPWAWLIINGHKDIENRSWKTKFRGEILVHASKEIDKQFWHIKKWVEDDLGIMLPDWQDLETGGIVGKVTIADCVGEHLSPWKQPESFGFVLTNPIPMKFIPFSGKLGFFEVPPAFLA